MEGFCGLVSFAQSGGKFHLLSGENMLFRRQLAGFIARKNLGRLPGASRRRKVG